MYIDAIIPHKFCQITAKIILGGWHRQGLFHTLNSARLPYANASKKKSQARWSICARYGGLGGIATYRPTGVGAIFARANALVDVRFCVRGDALVDAQQPG